MKNRRIGCRVVSLAERSVISKERGRFKKSRLQERNRFGEVVSREISFQERDPFTSIRERSFERGRFDIERERERRRKGGGGRGGGGGGEERKQASKRKNRENGENPGAHCVVSWWNE